MHTYQAASRPCWHCQLCPERAAPPRASPSGGGWVCTLSTAQLPQRASASQRHGTRPAPAVLARSSNARALTTVKKPEPLLQLAKHRGIRTINVVRRQELADELKALG